MKYNKDEKRKLWIRIVAALLAVFLVIGIVFSSFRASAFDADISDSSYGGLING